MSESLSPQEMIRANAEMVLEVARKEYDPHIGFDAAGVRWLDGYIQGLVDRGSVEATEELCDNLGSYLGTCIIETYGGTWQDTEHGWAVVMVDDLAVFPFNKTLKHLTEGAGDSVLSLFNGIPALSSHASGTADAAAAGLIEAVEQTAEPSARGSSSFMSRLGRLFRR